MPGDTAIEWTDKSWNPTTGCTQVSPGCAHCYAKTLTERFHGKGSFDNVTLHPKRLLAPLSWKTPSRVFVNSMSDLFHDDIPEEFIDKVFAVMSAAGEHTFQVLTKRPERMRAYMQTATERRTYAVCKAARELGIRENYIWPCFNVWLGVTVENQRFADVRIPILLDTPAAVHFVSAEPLLGPVDLRLDVQPLEWVIVGGESGNRHRRFDPDWAKSIIADSRRYGVACFVKQLGGARPGNKLEDLPEDLRVREYPVARD